MNERRLNNGYILGISFVCALGGYLFGFDFAVISGALPFLRQQFVLTATTEGLLTGTLALGCIPGCLIAGKVADRYGRRPGLLTAAIIFAFSSLGLAFCSSLIFFLIMRFAAGVGVGMASVLSPLYIAEISPASTRGRNVAINQLTIVIGILVTNLINYTLSGAGINAWRWMFGWGFVPAMLFFLGVLWLPESPRWLLQANKQQKAQRILQKMGGVAFAAAMLSDISKSNQPNGVRSFKAVLHKSVRPAVIVGVTLALFQQLCGINIVFNYTSTIFAAVGASLDRQLLETVAIGVVNLIFTLLAMWQIDKLGRRPLMLIGSFSLCLIYIMLAVALQGKWSTGFVSLFVLLAIATYATSLAPVTWVLISEIFPNNIRAMATSTAIVSLWIGYFVLVSTFPLLAKQLGTYGPFYFYAGVCLLGFFFVRISVKETKGKTLEELEQTFSQ